MIKNTHIYLLSLLLNIPMVLIAGNVSSSPHCQPSTITLENKTTKPITLCYTKSTLTRMPDKSILLYSQHKTVIPYRTDYFLAIIINECAFYYSLTGFSPASTINITFFLPREDVTLSTLHLENEHEQMAFAEGEKIA